MGGLNVVCLISGGKDSFFSILHCMKNGHNIIALVNLHPPDHEAPGAVEDLDSYMFQTVGHTIVPLYAQALGLPLYRQEIPGSAVNQEKCYGPSSVEDETEALVPVLRTVVDNHPEVNAVSTGAILSDYQRTRVESVALRLGLTPLSYLWQYPNMPPYTQISLLQHMAAVRQDSRIIKVASGGLDDSFLWSNVADKRTISRLERAVQRFGSSDDGAVLGEGGEYETLAISGPSCLWKGEIVVDEANIQTVLGEAGSASVRITGAAVSPRGIENDSLKGLEIPALLEPQFRTMLDGLRDDDVAAPTLENEPVASSHTSDHPSTATGGANLFWADLTGSGSSAADQMHSIMEQAQTLLSNSERTFADMAYTAIILRDMDDFPAINAVYGASFTHANPPARVTIASSQVLPQDKHVMVSFTVSAPSSRQRRTGLHVQSRSYWAPANIGPYSQAISLPLGLDSDSDTAGSLVYIAGQIPLIPASMELAGSGTADEVGSFRLQTVLALQHVARVGRAMHVQRWARALAFITASGLEEARVRARLARRAWDALHQSPPVMEDEGDDNNDPNFDVWDARHGAARSAFGAYQAVTAPGTSTTLGNGKRLETPALHVICVDTLPRNASIEWVMYGLTETGTGRGIEGTGSVEIPQYEHFLRIFERNIVLG